MSPDGSHKPPPEEKLLRLIRGKAPHPPTAAPRPGPLSGALGGAPAAAPTALPAAVVAALTTRATQAARGARWPDLAGWLLTALLAAEAAGILLTALRPLPRVEPPPVASGAKLAGAAPGAGPAAAPLAQAPSLTAAASPSLFAAASTAAKPSGPAGVSVTTRQLGARLMLVGIVAGEPSQAIIEDTQTQRTYMVSPGQAVTEGAVLERVLDNHVVLDVGGEKIELVL